MLPLPAGREASAGVVASAYERHRPQRTFLYQLVEEHYPAFKAELAAQGTALPRFVEREFDEHLKCGHLEHGFLRVRCETCHAEHLAVDEGGSTDVSLAVHGEAIEMLITTGPRQQASVAMRALVDLRFCRKTLHSLLRFFQLVI